MDVAYYLSELLGQLGEVNVPGLGYFVLLRIDGYYNEEEGTFYPPSHKIQFDPQFIEDDDALAQYIADKKHISLASSKYFTKKYIDSLTEQVMSQDVELADMGTLSAGTSKIIFKTADTLGNDPDFLGYPPIKVNKLGGTSIIDQLKLQTVHRYQPSIGPKTAFVPESSPAHPEPEAPFVLAPGSSPTPKPADVYNSAEQSAITPEPGTYLPTAPQYDESAEDDDFVFRGKTYVEEEGRSIWLTILLVVVGIIVVVLLGWYAIFKFDQPLYNKIARKLHPVPVVLKPLTTSDTGKSKTDTAKKTTAIITDTTLHAKTATVPLNNTPAGIDSTKPRYEIISSSWKTMTEANKVIASYKSMGARNAHAVTGVPGKRIKISLGTYNIDNDSTAKKDLQQLLSIKHIPKNIYILKINPKQ
jgi:hypothetical protein